MSIPQEVGTRIRRERINKGKSQDDMAKALDLTMGAYAKIERGETDTSATRLFELAKILQVDVTAFLKDHVGQDGLPDLNSFISRSEYEILEKKVDQIHKKLGIRPEKSATVKKSVTRRPVQK